MIDTHCHLLWRLDDGPRSAAASMQLARALVDQGVETALCTPHYSARYPTSHAAARGRFDELRNDLVSLGIRLRVELGAEVASKLSLSVAPQELVARSVGGFLVVELEPRAPADTPLRVLDRLREVELTPIFAHPERSRSYRDDQGPLEDALAAGALAQVVSSSLVGRWGDEVSGAAWSMLESGRADLLATDAHSAAGSVQQLRQIVERVRRRYGSDAVEDLTLRTPAKVLNLKPAGI